MLNQTILKVAEVMENGSLRFNITVESRQFASPKGALVIDERKLDENVSKALDYVYYTELAGASCKATEAYNKTVDRFNDGKAEAEDVAKAEYKMNRANAMYSAYPAVDVSIADDDFAIFTACVITGSRIVNIDRASFMLACLRSSDADTLTVKKAVVEYVDNMFNLKTANSDYVKPYQCSLNNKAIENLQRVARSVTLKWTKDGITNKRMKDMALWQQTMLNVYRDAFRLIVETKDTNKDYICYA